MIDHRRGDGVCGVTTLTQKQLSLLRHMLGINIDHVRRPDEYRDYAATPHDDQEFMTLQNHGMVRRYRRCEHYDWWTTTDAGKQAARASQRAMLLPKRKRMYLRFLSCKDAVPDLTFIEFLTSGDYADIRRAV